MDTSELAFKVGTLAGQIAQLQHAGQCEADNMMNNGPCDCGLKAMRETASAVIAEVMERVSL